MFLRFELTIFQYWFRQWLGTDQATKHYLNQWWLVYWCIYASLGLNELNVVYILQYIRTHEVMCWIPKNFRTASRTATGYLVRIIMAGPILGLLPANERRRYFVTTSLIGWVLTQNQPCNGVIFILISLSLCYFLIFFLESMTLSSGRNKHLAYNISQFNNTEEKQTTLMKSHGRYDVSNDWRFDCLCSSVFWLTIKTPELGFTSGCGEIVESQVTPLWPKIEVSIPIATRSWTCVIGMS